MAVLLVASPMPGAGKTGAAAALAMKLAYEGRSVSVSRIMPDAPGDSNAADDARVFASLPFPQEGARALSAADAVSAAKAAAVDHILILEAPRGADIAALAEALDARVVLVLRGAPAAWPEAPALGDRLLGTVALAVPEGQVAEARAALESAGLHPLGVVPEDRTLFGPSVREIVEELRGEVVYDSGNLDDTMDHLVIAPVSSDPGRPYFQRYPHKVVVTRVDKPDLILSALNGGANCLVLCGHEAPMLYIVDRAHHEEVTIILSRRSTAETMQALENIYDHVRFQGERKLERMLELMDAHVDLARALGAATA